MNKHLGRDALAHLRSIVNSDPELLAEYELLGPRYQAISEVIRARRRKGLSQRDLASMMGVSQSVLGRLEAGVHSPTVDTLAKAADAMGMKLQIKLVRDAERRVESSAAAKPRARVNAKPQGRVAAKPAVRAPARGRTRRTA